MKNHIKIRKKKVLRGSFTIEASFLLPILVFLIWNIMFVTFFLYDQCTVLQGNYCTALRTERMMGILREKEKEAEEKYDLSVRKKIAAADLQWDITITDQEVTVETEFVVKGPGIFFFRSIWNGQQKQAVRSWEPVRFIRNCRKAENILDMM